MFLSGAWIEGNGAKLFFPFNVDQVDCSAYTMRIGHEAYVSPESGASSLPIRQLSHRESLIIPPGQFAFLITREHLRIPHDLFGLINLKNSLKVQGLINVSGFHVDPGYSGNLIFAVFNAGPKSIFLRENDPAFLIWLTRLEEPSTIYARKKAGYSFIDSVLASNIPKESDSINSLGRRIDELNRKFSYILWGFATLVTIAAAALGEWIFKITGG